MASGYSAKRFEENRGNRKLCHLNPFEFFDHTGFRGTWYKAGLAEVRCADKKTGAEAPGLGLKC